MLAEKPSIGVFTAARPEPTASLADVFDAAVESGRYVDNVNAAWRGTEEAYDRRIDAIKRAIGIELENPYRSAVGSSAGEFELPVVDPFEHFDSELKRLAEQFPQHIETIQPDRSPREDAREKARQVDARFQDVYARAPAGWRWWAAFAGGFRASFEDPFNVATLFLGPMGRVGVGAAQVVWMGVKQAVANAGVEAVAQPFVQRWRAEAGLDHGFSEAAWNVAVATAFGFGVDVGVRGTFRGVQRFRGRVPELDAEGNVVRWRRPDEALDDAARRMGKSSTVRKAAEGDLKALERLARETGAADDPAVRGATQAAEIEAEIARPTPPLTDRGDGLAALAQALRAAEDPIEPPPMRPDPVPEATARSLADDAPAPPARFRMDGKPVTFREVRAGELVTDAATFQFKAGGDAEGATGRLAGVRQWDPLAAGRIIVFERADGTLVIADGHQRLSLARRLEAEGHEPITMQAVVFREADGWTPSDVRALAAKKNLQEGSGTVIDAARVIRERPGILDSSVPLGTEAMRQARALAKLSDEALAAVINGEIAPNHAAVVGELVRDRTQHAALIRQLIEAEPKNVREARHMVADLMQIGARAEAQRTILGADRRALVAERARVLDRAIRLFREDARIFAVLSREARRIEAAGNRLAIETNADRALTGEAVVALMEDLAVRGGPVSDLLDEAARAVEAGTKVKAAAQDFVDAVREIVERDGLAGLMPREEPLRGARGIDVPGGPEAQAQVAALERELEARINRALEVAAERAIDKWAAWSRANGRPLPELNPLARAEAVRLIRGGTAVADAVDRAIVEAAAAAREAETPRPPVDPLAELTDEERESVIDTWRFVQEMRRRKRPERLVDFLRSRGGLKDEGGDVRHILGRAKDRPGLINNRRGMELDDAARLAHEHGFLPGVERPTINDLLSAIDEDLRGTMVVRQADRELLDDFLIAEQMEADLGRLGLDDAKTEEDLRQRLRDAAAEGREGLGGDQARAGRPEDQASLDDPPFAVGDIETRGEWDLALAQGRPAQVAAEVVEATRAALGAVRDQVPEGWRVGVLQAAEPLPSGRSRFIFADLDGKRFSLNANWAQFRGKRAAVFNAGRAILIFQLGWPRRRPLRDDLDRPILDELPEVLDIGAAELVGRLLHELGHIRIDATLRSALSRHAEALRILDLQWNDFASLIGRDDLVVDGYRRTLREIYAEQYSTRQNRDDLMAEEAIMHMVELIHHGAISPRLVAPIQPLLEELFSADGGEFIGRRIAASENAPVFAFHAFHASPHDFDRFDTTRIGTGEGHQTFGHGLYFAESEAVSGRGGHYDRIFSAEPRYLELASGERIPLPVDEGTGRVRHLHKGMPARDRALILAADPDGIDAPIARVRRFIQDLEAGDRLSEMQLSAGWGDLEILRETLAELQALKAQGARPAPPRIYEVRIDAEPEDLLDWDKPFSQQSKKVREAVRKLWNVPEDRLGHSILMDIGLAYGRGRPARELYKIATEKLREVGIKGVRYLDQLSRASGEGSRNFVIFDDSIIEIVAKDGKPVTRQERADLLDQHRTPPDDDMRFAMAGPLARNADLARLEAAQVMENAGRTAFEIWQATGWFRGADGLWRFEIPDRDARLKMRAEKVAKGQFATKVIEGRADEILDHPLLWEAYPELRRVRVTLMHDRRLGRRGATMERPREIHVRAPSAKQARLTLLHELQHLIQRRENFARGGSPGYMALWVRKAIEDLDREAAAITEQLEALEATIAPFDPASAVHWRASLLEQLGTLLYERDQLERTRGKILYLKLAGEVEARNVERRSRMRREERLAASPEMTEDVPRAEQIIRKDVKGPQLAEDWEEALWEELTRRTHALEQARERAEQRPVVQRRARSEVEIEADRLAQAFRDFEEKLAGEGLSAAEIAAAMTRHFGVEVDADAVARRMVWWRIDEVLKADRRAGRIPERPATPPPRKSVGFGLSKEERAMARDMVRAGQSVIEIARALTEKRGSYVSVAAVSQTVGPEGIDRALAPTEHAVAAPDLAGLTAREVAERLSERLGRPVTPRAVYRARDRAKQKGIKLPPLSDPRGPRQPHGRRPTWLNEGKFEWTPEALAMLTREDLAGMTAAELAELLSQTFGGRLTANAVRLKRSKLARELDQANRVTELKDTVDSCKL